MSETPKRRGPKPSGQAMSGAERQRRYIERLIESAVSGTFSDNSVSDELTTARARIAELEIIATNPERERGDISGESQAVEMIVQLREREGAIQRGDLSQAEAMLFSQAEALQTLFVRLTERGLRQPSMDNLSAFLKMGLKAQAQCRATLESLAKIKNPTIFAAQLNQTSGPQQVNTQFNSGSRAEEKQNGQSKLSADTRATCPPIGGHSPIETVGAVNRTENAEG